MAPAPTGSPGRVSWYGRMAAAVTLRRMTRDAPSPRPPPHPPSPVPGQSEAVPGQSEADRGQSEAARDEPGIDLHTTAGKIADLQRRRDEAVHAGSARAVERQHAKGKMTARERIERLLDPDSFTELDELARHRATAFGVDANRPYGDGVVTGFGLVDGRPVCVYSQDFTVFGGSLGEVYGEKIVKVMDHAMKTGCPVIGINDGAGLDVAPEAVTTGVADV